MIGEKKSTDREDLLKALEQGDINALKKLVPHSFSVRSALDLAMQLDYLAGMKAILDTFSSDLNKQQDYKGSTLLMRTFYDAIRDKKLNAVNLLINYIDVNKTDRGKKTFLMTAAQYSTPAIVQLLLQKGVNPNVIGGYENQTALMYAVKKLNLDVILPLLNANADPLVKNKEGKDALDIAQEELDALVNAGEREKQGKYYQQEKEDYEKIIKLLESKIPPTILEQKSRRIARKAEEAQRASEEQVRQQEAAQLAQEEATRQEQERQRLAQVERERLAREAEEARKIEERLRQEQLTRERLEQERLERERLAELERQRQARETPISADNKPLLSALQNLTQKLRILQQYIIIK